MVTGYISLPIESTPEEISEEALDTLTTAFPGYHPEHGHLTTWMIFIWARMHSENRIVTTNVSEMIFRYFGESFVNLPRIEATRSTVPSTWVMLDDAGYTVEAGTVVGLRIAGDELVPFRTIEDFTVDPGSTSTAAGAVMLEAVEAGQYPYSGIPAGAAELIDSLSFVNTITTTEATSAATDTESDADYMDRLRQELRLLTPRPILASEFATVARRISGVHRALGIDNFSPGRSITGVSRTSGSPVITAAGANFTALDEGRTAVGTGIPGGTTILTVDSSTQATLSANATSTAASGTVALGDLSDVERLVTVALVDDAGEPVVTAVKDDVVELLESLREVNFIVQVTDPTYTVVNVAFTATIRDGFDPDTTIGEAETAVQEFIDPANWGGGDQDPPVWDAGEDAVRLLEVGHVIYGVPGIQDVTALTLNGGTADVTLAGVAPLPDPASTVTGTAA